MNPWPYDLTAEFYDEDMGRNAGSGDIAWYVAGATVAAGRGAVLELGCGTGRVTLPLAAGLDVVAIDRSPPMLRRLVQKAEALGLAGRIKTAVADMSRLCLDTHFGAILCPYSAFGYLIELEDRDRMLATVRGALSPGGVFLLDMFIPDPALADFPDDVEIQDFRRPLPPGPWSPAITFARSKRLARDIRPGVNRIERRYRFFDDGDRLVREIRTESFQRPYQPEALAAVLADAGFGQVSICGDFEVATAAKFPARIAAIVARVGAL
jgi:SAM-dependent methyltransferase